MTTSIARFSNGVTTANSGLAVSGTSSIARIHGNPNGSSRMPDKGSCGCSNHPKVPVAKMNVAPVQSNAKTQIVILQSIGDATFYLS